MDKLTVLYEALILSFALSLDSFVASLAYGSSKIKIPNLSVIIINIICSLVLGLSMLVGSFIGDYIPFKYTIIICFCVLLILGVTKLMDTITKNIIKKHNNLSLSTNFSIFNFKFVLSLYADPKVADIDNSKSISSTEAVSLAIALSLDGLAVGFGAGMGNLNVLAVFILSFIINTISILMGLSIGNKMAKKYSFDISWLSGVMLIVLAFSKLF